MNQAVADWVVRNAVPEVLKRAGRPEEAEVLVSFGPSVYSFLLMLALAAKHPSYRSLTAAVLLANRVANGQVGADVAEKLAHSMAAMSGLSWVAGGSA
jgi:hypothetical protein